MPKINTSVILLINQSKEICEKQFSVFGSKGDQISPLMHVPLSYVDSLGSASKKKCSNSLGHLTKMAATRICGKNLFKYSSPEPEGH